VLLEMELTCCTSSGRGRAIQPIQPIQPIPGRDRSSSRVSVRGCSGTGSGWHARQAARTTTLISGQARRPMEAQMMQQF
jgi:hypothetical protein